MANDEDKNADENATGEEENAEGGGKSKKKLIIIIAAAVLLLGGIGGGAAFFLLGPSKPEVSSEAGEAADNKVTAEKKTDEKAEGDKPNDKKKSKSDEKDGFNFAKVYKFAPFHLNLGNPLENRYIRLELAVEYKGGDLQKAELESKNPRLRDAVITVTSRKSREFLLGPDGKDQLRKEILNKVNQYLDKKVENVYITDIIIE